MRLLFNWKWHIQEYRGSGSTSISVFMKKWQPIHLGEISLPTPLPVAKSLAQWDSWFPVVLLNDWAWLTDGLAKLASTELLYQLHSSENGCGCSILNSSTPVDRAQGCSHSFGQYVPLWICYIFTDSWAIASGLFGLPLGKPEADRLKTPLGAN